MRIPQRKAVAPVIATLLMIAVAVAMSVIIFMWSQGFLSNTSSATGGQQGAQNQAAQSSISIEAGVFVDGTSATACPTGGCQVTVIVRNVGAVGVTLGSLQVSGSASNPGFTGHVTIATLTGITATTSGTATSTGVAATDGTAWKAYASTSLATVISKGNAVSITLLSPTTVVTTSILSGDVINVKITTAVGTFAQAQFTVP